MCDVMASVANDPTLPESNRRQFLKVLGAAAAAGGLVASGVGTALASPGGNNGLGRGGKGRTRLVLLGTAGGPSYAQSERFGISTAVVYGDSTYIVDLGLGSLMRFRQSSASGTPGVASMWNGVRGVFFTHMHSDHLTDWPAAWATANANSIGRPVNAPKVEVFGPGNRGVLPRIFPSNRPVPPQAPYNPADPTPGITGMTDYLTKAWANDFNDRFYDGNFAGPAAVFHVQDIHAPYTPTPLGSPPAMDPFLVWKDGDVTVTATLVDHHPTAPAFGFRFDTPDGSVTISGDTAVSPNLIKLAQGTDYLVHEVIDPDFVEKLVLTLPPQQQAPLREHLLGAHTTIEQVGAAVAEPAGAKNLVLTHLVPADNPKGRWMEAKKGYSGRLVVGEDLMELRVGG